jgi:hypothetical protein
MLTPPLLIDLPPFWIHDPGNPLAVRGINVLASTEHIR